jgi:hypothetical protein
MNEQPQEQCPVCDQLPAACKCEKPQAGDHDCEYDNESEDSRCKHCGLTSGEAVKYFESKVSEQLRKEDAPQKWTTTDVLRIWQGERTPKNDHEGMQRVAVAYNAALATLKQERDAWRRRLLHEDAKALKKYFGSKSTEQPQEKWTRETVINLIAEAFESGGETTASELISERHNAELATSWSHIVSPLQAELANEQRKIETAKVLCQAGKPYDAYNVLAKETP